MEITHIEHIGIAVKSIEEQLPYYENILGLKCYNIETVEDQKVKTAFFMVGQTKIELLEPTSEDSTVAKFIEKKGVESKGVKLIDKEGRAGAEGLTIGFLHPKSTGGVLTEFCEHPEK